MLRRRTTLIASAVFVLFGSSLARAMFIPPKDVPVDRLIQNITAYIKEHPDDADGYYTLARVHNLAFTLRAASLRVYERQGQLASIPDMFNRDTARHAELDEKALREHLRTSVENYETALAKSPKNALYTLGLASILEAGAATEMKLPPIASLKADPQPANWRPVYLNMAIREYLAAYDLAIEKDLAVRSIPLRGLQDLVSHEAAVHYLTLVKKPDAEDGLKNRTEEIEAALKKLRSKPHGPITPIVFSMRPAARLDDLLAPDQAVKFDLDGTGRGDSWPWVKPDTAILVWDPRHTGKIESGRQLFGSVTFWMFWRDGYAALDALDDNRDGQLSSNELGGLCAWFDRNSNGVSDPGEVVGLQSLGIESISARATAREGLAPCNRLGMRLSTGAVLPTWDWITSPVDSSK